MVIVMSKDGKSSEKVYLKTLECFKCDLFLLSFSSVSFFLIFRTESHAAQLVTMLRRIILHF